MSTHLARAARTRHESALSKATVALHELSVRQLPITFVAVARRAGVSTDFLYRQPELRSRIAALRNAARPATEPPGTEPADSTSAAVRALSARLKQAQARHRAEMADMQRALAAAHGENLTLRRQLAAYQD